MDHEDDLALLPVSTSDWAEGGEGGKGGVFQLTNAQFVAKLFPAVPEGAYAAVCSKDGDPNLKGWPAF